MATLEVINLGWGRTGTASFAEAMKILGYNTYHMSDVGMNNHSRFWIKVANGEVYDFNEIFKVDKPVAVCDFPAVVYYKKLLEKFPNAKLILQTRDPESWFRSCDETILLAQPNYVRQPFGLQILQWLNLFPLKAEFLNCLARDAWNNDMTKENLIKYKLLLFKPSDGWGPLCKYLNKPVPDIPYPHANDTKSFRRMIDFANVMGYVVAAALVALPIGLGWSLRSIKRG